MTASALAGDGASAAVVALFAGASALILEDDPDYARLIVSALRSGGFEDIVAVEDGDSALARASLRRFDILIFDRKNPGLEGVEVLKRLRALRPDPDNSAASPVLIVTATDALSERLSSIAAGADDYIPKQGASAEEIVARVAAQLQKRTAQQQGPYRFGAFLIDPLARTLYFRNTSIDLRGKGFELMLELIKAAGTPLTHLMLWDRCWKYSFVPDEYRNSVDAAIRKLRIRMREAMPPEYGQTDSVVANVWTEGFVVRKIPDQPE